MKESIIKIYNVIINYIIDFFHIQKKKFFRTCRRTKNKFKKFWYYEELGFLSIIKFIKNIGISVYKSKLFKKFRMLYGEIDTFIRHLYRRVIQNYKNYLESVRNDNNSMVVNFKDNYSKFFTPKIMAKGCLVLILSVFLIYDAYSWFYNEYQSKGTNLAFGTVEHEVTQYTSSGAIIGETGDTLTVVEEDNLGNVNSNTRYISIKNSGTLDIDYVLSFTLDGTISNAGTLFYRVIDITDEVNESVITQTYNTKLKSYAANNPTPANLETDAINPVSNLTTISQVLITGEIDKDEDVDDNNIRYYRIDYGMYQTITSSLYSGASVAVHANVYTTQRGIGSSLNSEGQTWLVENESQFREAVLNALSGDTIKLADNISIDGTIDFTRRIHLNTDSYDLNITGDLTYDFVEMGALNIDTSNGGQIDVLGELYINTPKSSIHFIGQNQSYDIYVGSTFTVNGIQNEEEDGVLFENVRIVKNKIGNIPVDVIVKSNTRVTIAPNVEINYIIAANNATNIEILNNGTVTQIQLQNMNLIDSFSKYQIYVYNLNTILGVLGGSSIVLPSNSTPYTGPNTGNTLIIRGVSSNDISVSGSAGYDGSNITQGAPEDSVIPIQGELDSYYVYIRDNNETLQGLLEAYFNELNPNTTTQKIFDIKKLIIYTLNSAYFENADFAYIDSAAMGSIEYLGLSNATLIDVNVLNRVASNTLQNKTTLKTVILSKTTTTIGTNAFQNVNLGRIPATGNFEFLSIPSTVVSISSGAFASTRYVNFEGQVPPTIESGAFNTSSTGTKFFVPIGALNVYRNTININPAYVYYAASLSDNKQYFLYDYEDGYGISYFINNVSIGTDLTIPAISSVSLVNKNITAIGVNAYRGLITDAAGADITLPSTVVMIDEYAFYNDNINSINLNNVEIVNQYALYNTNIDEVIGDNIEYVGDYAFYSVPIKYLTLESVLNIGSHAFTDATTLFEANLGHAKVIGDYAFYNCPNLGRVWFKNTSVVMSYMGESIDLTVGENALFGNWGAYLNGRLRVYVPNGQSLSGFNYLNGYKTLFQAYESYIYPMGIIIGSYTHNSIPYDWGDYSVRSVTKNNAAGTPITAYELIEYHGDDLTSDYNIPDVITADEGVTAGITGFFEQNGSPYPFHGTLTIHNNTDEAITDWTVRLSVPTGVTAFTTNTNAIESLEGNIMTLTNQSYNGSIAAGSTRTISFSYTTTVQTNAVTVINAYSSGTPLMEIISIGEYAYRHVHTVTGHTIDIVANSLLNIDDHGLENISISSMVANNLVNIGNYALHNTGLNSVSFSSAQSIGNYAMSDMDSLYSIRLGDVQVMGQHAISNNPNLEQIFLATNNTTNVSIHATAMSNIGTNANDRLRIYVNENNVTFFKSLLSNYADYIYLTGTIVGSFTNWPIPYDIGEYSVRLITLQNRNGADVNGLEIVEYHGADIDNTFNIPTSYTISGVTYDVISVGNYAYSHTNDSNDGGNQTNNVIMRIGSHAFDGIAALANLSSSSLLEIGDYAFNNGVLESLIAPNLRSVGSYAIANMNSTYKLDLGGVSSLRENSFYNLPNLVQTFFDPNNDTRIFDEYAFTNVGSLTNDRMRFYVKGSISTTSSTNTYDADLSISRNCGNPQTSGNSSRRTYTYSCTATVRNTSNHAVYDWVVISNNLGLGTTTSGYGNYLVNTTVSLYGSTNASYTTSSTTATFTSNGNTNVTIAANGTITFGYIIRVISERAGSSGTVNANWANLNSHSFTGNALYDIVESSTTTLFLTEEYASTFRTEYEEYWYDYYGYMIGTYTSSTIPNNIGEYSVIPKTYIDSIGNMIDGLELVEYHGINLTSDYILPTTLTVGGETYNVIGIGDRAFKWVNHYNGAKVDLTSTYIKYVEDDAFRGIQCVHIVDFENAEEIGQYAFFNNILYTVSLDSLVSIGNYALANNSTLNYLNLGNVSSIGEGALYNDSAIEQIFFTNTDRISNAEEMRISIGNNAFYNVGTSIGDRFRIYVPNSSNDIYVRSYKNTLSSNFESYIFPTGIMIGTYQYAGHPYDIGEYSVRQVTVTSYGGTNATGWEVVEYHGPDITTGFTIADSMTLNNTTYNVVSIGDYAFYYAVFSSDCEFELPNYVYNIGDYAFYGAEFIRVEGVQIRTLGSYSFANCDNLLNFVLDGVYTVSDHALYHLDEIRYIQLGQGVDSLGEYSLWNPYPDGPTTLLSMQVSSVPNTAQTALPDYETIGYNQYHSNFSYAVPSTQTQALFRNRTPWLYHTTSTAIYLQDFLLVLHDDRTATITGYTGASTTLDVPYTYSTYVNYYQIQYTIDSLSADMLDNNTFVQILNIGSNIEHIDSGFLSGNQSVQSITVTGGNYYSSANGVLFSYAGTELLKYPNGKTDTSYTIPTNVDTIATEAFKNQTHLESVTFNSGLVAIGAYAFKGCTNIEEYTFPTTAPALTSTDTFDGVNNFDIRVRNTYRQAYRSSMFFKDYYYQIIGY